MEKVLECCDLSYAYPSGKVVFKDINLVTYRHELVGIVGPTGTGKSTLVRTIAHLIPPTKGHVYLEGIEVIRPSPKIALIHQSIATFPWMTALDNVKLSLRCERLPDEEMTRIAERMLDLVGLGDAKELYPKEMSGGMRQKMTIARALAASPVVLLLDEPFVYLDEITAENMRKEVYALIFSLESTLKSTVLVSHNLREVVELSDRVYVLEGTPAEIVDEIKVDLPRPRNARAPEFLDYVDRLHSELRAKKG